MSKYLKAEIKENTPINKSHNLLVLNTSDISDEPLPGQFYMIGSDNSYDPLLKRPFSIFKKAKSEIQFLYRIKGKGTKKMRQMKKGDTIHLIGPLGKGYPMPDKNLKPVIIAGGIGIASLYPLIEKLNGNVSFIYGAKTKDDLLMLQELKNIVKELFLSTDNGSVGEKGTVIDVLDRLLTRYSTLDTRHLLYACGPPKMLEAVSKIALEKGIKGYISLEENMACGVGACLGCAVKTKKGFERVCKEGPVFRIEEIVW